MATFNLGRILPIWKGNWSSTARYAKLDIVYYNGASWSATSDNQGSTPSETNSNWTLVSKNITEVHEAPLDGKAYVRENGLWVEGAKKDELNNIGADVGDLSDRIDSINQASVQTIGDKKYLVFSSGKVVVPVEIPSIDFDLSTKQVSLSASSGLKIFYTTDGTTPTTSGNRYAIPFVIESGANVKAITYNDTDTSSVAKITSKVTLEGDDATLDFISSVSGTIRYTTNNTEPTATSTAYTNAIALSVGQTYKIGVFSGSQLVSEIATIQTLN